MILVDANLLIYAVNRDAPQHAAARDWWEETLSGTTPVGLPWLVMLAFVRLSTNARVMRSPASTEQALHYTHEWLAQPYVTPLNPGESHWLILSRLLADSGAAGNLTNDAHIAAIAIEQGYVVYSADNDFQRFQGIRHVNPLSPGGVHESAASWPPS